MGVEDTAQIVPWEVMRAVLRPKGVKITYKISTTVSLRKAP